MSEISKQQNLQHNIDLLIAQRFYYSRAKKIRNFRIVVSVIFALLSPIIFFFMPNQATTIGAIGGIWALIAYLLKKLFENSNIEKAAKIQEEFDTALFKVNWNSVLAGEKVSFEDVNYAKEKFRGDTTKLKDWYSSSLDFPYPIDVLLCQRSNLVWDWRLKKVYSIAIFVVVIVYLIATIILGSVLELKLSEYILGLFLPALSGYFIGIDEGTDHFKASNKRKNLEKKINILSDAALNRSSLNLNELRQIQDCIFEFRKGPMVADWFYWLFRDRFENNMIKALEDFRRKLGS